VQGGYDLLSLRPGGRAALVPFARSGVRQGAAVLDGYSATRPTTRRSSPWTRLASDSSGHPQGRLLAERRAPRAPGRPVHVALGFPSSERLPRLGAGGSCNLRALSLLAVSQPAASAVSRPRRRCTWPFEASRTDHGLSQRGAAGATELAGRAPPGHRRIPQLTDTQFRKR
jgi:hypothetical protein